MNNMAVYKGVKARDNRMADTKRLPKMKEKYKKKWLKALRSGEYDQTIGQLASDDGYCCLGVLCEVVAQDHPDMHDYIDYGSGAPPEEVWELVLTKEALKTLRKEAISLGDEIDPEQRAKLSINPLIVRNDGTRKFDGKPQSFKQIANIIEKNM
jgi:hypothetical protein